jgi:hypothetical protein
MAMRPLTKEELTLYQEAHKVLPTPIIPGTNITIVSYILEGRIDELKQLMKEAKTRA